MQPSARTKYKPVASQCPLIYRTISGTHPEVSNVVRVLLLYKIEDKLATKCGLLNFLYDFYVGFVFTSHHSRVVFTLKIKEM